ERYAEVPGTFEKLPDHFAREGAQKGGMEAPEDHIDDDSPHWPEERPHPDRDVDRAYDGHQGPRPPLWDAPDREVGQPCGLCYETERAMTDEARGDGDAKNPVKRRLLLGRKSFSARDRKWYPGVRLERGDCRSRPGRTACR